MKRPKEAISTSKHTIPVRIRRDLLERVEALKAQTGIPKQRIVETAVLEYVARLSGSR